MDQAIELRTRDIPISDDVRLPGGSGEPPDRTRPDQAGHLYTLAVENMRCGNCMRTIETTLAAQPGVVSARANLGAKRVTIATLAAGPTAQDLAEALSRAGFRAADLAVTPAGPAAGEGRAYFSYLAVSGFAAANIMLLSVAVWAGIVSDMGPAAKTLFHWLSALIALPAVAYAGQPFFRSAVEALSARRLNMDVPISLGVLLATGMSLVQTARGNDHVYFDAAVTLLFFLLIGRALDAAMRAKTAGAAANLIGLQAVTASVLRAGDRIERLSARLVQPGDRMLVAAGERIAVDGVVRSGSSEIDDSLITGETRLKAVHPGTIVHSGTVNAGQPIVVEATASSDGSLIADIARMMAAAEQNRSRYVRLADRAARLYAPAVHILGLATLAGWLAAGAGWEASLITAIAVLIITCPCALALAVPAVQVAASSRLFARGIVVKAADGLERLAEIDTVVLDKTGTLTMAEPQLAETGRPSDDVLTAAASLAQASRHPYARALVKAAAAAGLELGAATGVSESKGAGVARQSSAGEERLGSAAWCGVPLRHVDSNGVDIDDGADDSGEARSASLWYRAAGAEPIAFHFEDRLRPDAAETIAWLKRQGLAVELLSGDRPAVVQEAARRCGIEVAHGGVRPDGKIARLEQLKREGRKVLMIGDGLNDAPALAAAHASLSPSTAADISQTAADAVFQGDRLAPITEALAVAKQSRRMALQNFAIALGYNAVFVPLAVAGLVTPLIAAIAMSASSLVVTGNSLFLRSKRLESMR